MNSTQQIANDAVSALQQGADWATTVMLGIAALGLAISFVGWLISRS